MTIRLHHQTMRIIHERPSLPYKHIFQFDHRVDNFILFVLQQNSTFTIFAIGIQLLRQVYM